GFDGGAARLVPDLSTAAVGGLVDAGQHEARGDRGEVQVHHHIELRQTEHALDHRPHITHQAEEVGLRLADDHVEADVGNEAKAEDLQHHFHQRAEDDHQQLHKE